MTIPFLMQQQTQITIGQYSFDSKYCIGQGSFGKVYKGRHIHTQQIVAIKQLDRALVSEQETLKQIEILKSLSHENIVKYEATLQTQDFFYIVTEYCNGGDLRNLLEDSDSDEGESGSSTNNKRLQIILDMFFQVCAGFNYLKKYNIIHRDLKPTNILIHNGVYKIADFGVARTEVVHKSLIHNDLIGVPIYMSPQILSKNYYSYKCDVWSLGIIVYEFYFECLPWKASDVNSLFFQIMDDPSPYLRQDKKLPSELRYIFENTLNYLEKKRMSWQELLSLKNKRKKIFDEKEKPNVLVEQSDIKFHKSIPRFEAEILSHILCQFQSLETELVSLLEQKHYRIYLKTIKRYSTEGQQYRQCFIDSGFFILRIAGEKLHLYMLDLYNMVEARPMLILLELIHDLISLPSHVSEEQFRSVFARSQHSEEITKYVESVLVKIGSFNFKPATQNIDNVYRQQ